LREDRERWKRWKTTADIAEMSIPSCSTEAIRSASNALEITVSRKSVSGAEMDTQARVPFLEGHVETFKYEMIAVAVAIFLAPVFTLL